MKSKIDWNKLTKFIKNRNFFIAVCVFALTIASIGISYASFFTVKTNTTNQVITTGSLAVSYGNDTKSVLREGMPSISNAAGMAQNESSVVYIQNTGTLSSTYVLNIGYDMDSFKNRSGYSDSDLLTPLDYVMFAVYEYNGAGVSDTLVAGPMSVTDLPIYSYDPSDYRNNRYAILFNTLGGTSSSNATKTYKIKMWLSDKAIPAASFTYFYLDTEVVAEVENAKMSYNLSGTVTLDSAALTENATINIQNGSIVTTTSDGSYALNNLYPGVYNVEITYNGSKYKGNITVEEGNVVSLASRGSVFTGSNIFTVANSYGTTVSKIIAKNGYDSYSDRISLSSGALYPTYKLIGGMDEDISGINIDLKSSTLDFAMHR